MFLWGIVVYMQDELPTIQPQFPSDQLPEPNPIPPASLNAPPKKSKPKFLLIISLAIIFIAAGASYWLLKPDNSTGNNLVNTPTEQKQVAQGLELDPNKNYGDKYKNGILPVGDKKYTTDAAKKGYIYLCNANFVPESQAGATARGPWFIGTTQWDINKKSMVNGQVDWTEQFSMSIASGKRVLTTNNLPDHHTGTYPVASSDPAYQYDRNPNSIKAQSLTYSLNANPTYGDPNCAGGEVGIMLTGVGIYNGFDAGGRDAGAWEVQDSCDGHPQNKGAYHYHTLSRCIKDVGVSKVIGFALDGFPITGPKVGEGNYLTTDDLDECHGITSEIILDNKKVKMYHYVMTQDFPYSVSCFRSKAEKAPGLPENAGQQGSQPTGMQPPPRR